MQESVWKQDMENVWTVVVSHVFAVVYVGEQYCPRCGQKLDWGE